MYDKYHFQNEAQLVAGVIAMEVNATTRERMNTSRTGEDTKSRLRRRSRYGTEQFVREYGRDAYRDGVIFIKLYYSA